MTRDPATRALNAMWAENREDEDVDDETLPPVVPSIGENMAVRLLRAKASTWSNLNDQRTNINGKLPREEPGAKRPRTRVATFSASRGRERVLPGGFLSLGAERSSQWERKPESFQVLENGGFWSGVATRRREEVETVPSDKNSLSPFSGSLAERGQRSRGNSCGQLGIAVKRPRHQVEYSLCLQLGF